MDPFVRREAELPLGKLVVVVVVVVLLELVINCWQYASLSDASYPCILMLFDPV